MERNNVLGMVCGYYLSRFDKTAYAHFGHPTQQATHDALGARLDVPADSIKNWRDEFDPVHDNDRQGWRKRGMHPSRKRTIEVLGDLAQGELAALVDSVMLSPTGAVATEVATAVGQDGDDESRSFSLRGPTGYKAEQAYVKFHEKHQLPVSGTLVDRTHDQCGYDFEIQSESGPVAVEVKGLAGTSGGVTFTDKEWRTAREMRSAYHLAVVRNAATDPRVSILSDPAAALKATVRTYTVIQVDWAVSQGVLKLAESEAAQP